MLQEFCQFIKDQQLITSKLPTLLAVSGGVDSMVMAHLFKEGSFNFCVAHCNFNLRGKEAEKEAQFVKNWAKTYQIPFFYKKFQTANYATSKGISIQMAARELRYQWFDTLLKTNQLGQIATAHHWNDSIETLLLNLIKGAGIAGLHGIAPKQHQLIRPLLFANKSEIIAYAQAQKMSWQEDPSNQTNYYQRNLLRNRVIPILKEINPGLDTTLQRTASKLAQTDSLLKNYIKNITSEVVTQQGDCYVINIANIPEGDSIPLVLYELVKKFGFTFTQVTSLVKNKVVVCGKQLLSHTHELTVDRSKWFITPYRKTKRVVYEIATTAKAIELPHGRINILSYITIPEGKWAPDVGMVDQDLLTFPLQVKVWAYGDTFYPLGMTNKKKISDFLIDKKVPLPLKKKSYVVLSHGEIVWIVGYRIDNRFKITPQTKRVYEMKFVARRGIEPLFPG